MKQRINKAIRCICFLTVFVFLFVNIQDVFVEDYTGSVLASGIYEMEDDTVQVIFLGCSHVYYGISPQEIYNHSGLVTYNCGTSIQSVSSSYYMLSDVLKHQSPEVVVLDAASLFYEEEIPERQIMVLNILKSMPNKLEMANYYLDCLNMDKNSEDENSLSDEDSSAKDEADGTQDEDGSTQDEDGNTGDEAGDAKNEDNNSDDSSEDTTKEEIAINNADEFVGIMLPVYSYHQRWKKLLKKDFVYNDLTNKYTKGYSFRNIYRDKEYLIEDMYEEVDEEYYLEINDTNLKYLLKIKDLCDENDIQLMLTAVPAVGKKESPTTYNKAKYDEVVKLSKKYGIDYFDLTYSEESELNLDERYDYYNDVHLNYSGAVKTSRYIGDYLHDRYGVKAKKNRQYDEDKLYYDKVRYIMKYAMSYRFDKYMELLNENADDLVVIVTLQGDGIKELTKDEKALLKQFGIKEDLTKLEGQAFICVKDGNEILYKERDGEKLEYTYRTDNTEIVINSYGAEALQKNTIVTTIDDINYACGKTGINIVILDKESELVLDSIYYKNKNSFNHIKDDTSNIIFSKYEEYVLGIK